MAASASGKELEVCALRPGLTSPPREGALRAAAGGSSKALLILQQSYRGGGTRKHTSC